MALKRSSNYKEKIELFMNDIENEEYLKFLSCESYHRKYTVAEDDWSYIERVSVDKDLKPLGLFKASVSRDSYNVDSLEIANITKKLNIILTRDMFDFLDYLLEVKKFNKISFSCYIGNPAEKIYDKIIKKYNGRIVGICQRHNRLSDGEFYDKKMYELLND